jgi:hypothetical protein
MNQSEMDKLGQTGPPRNSLQQQLDMARLGIENKQSDEKRNNDLNNAILLALVGIPISVGISTSVFFFTRKK